MVFLMDSHTDLIKSYMAIFGYMALLPLCIRFPNCLHKIKIRGIYSVLYLHILTQYILFGHKESWHLSSVSCDMISLISIILHNVNYFLNFHNSHNYLSFPDFLTSSVYQSWSFKQKTRGFQESPDSELRTLNNQNSRTSLLQMKYLSVLLLPLNIGAIIAVFS